MYATDTQTRESSPLQVRMWRLLTHPWLALAVIAMALALGLALALLPQLPPQLLHEPAGASRWLESAGDQAGVWGRLLHGMGLFNALHSPLLRLFLLLVALTVTAQLAEIGAVIHRVALWRKSAHGPAQPSIELVDGGPGPAYTRRRQVFASPASTVDPIVRSYAMERFDLVEQGETERTASANNHSGRETRYFCLQNRYVLGLRILLPAGLLIAVVGILLALALGWQSTPPLLAPGAVYRDGANRLQFTYPPPDDQSSIVSLIVRLGATETVIVPMPGRTYPIGPATLHVGAYVPGLWLTAADGSPQLVRPGRSDAATAVGIACAKPGMEDSLLVPAARAGLRIVCNDVTSGFSVELYQGESVQPVLTSYVRPGERLTVQVAEELNLELATVPSLAVTVNSFPQLWIAWLGVAVALVGASGFTLQDRTALVQVVDQNPEECAVVIQSSSEPLALAFFEYIAANLSDSSGADDA